MSSIMGISRLRMGTEGEGITTLVAFAGCPLHCKYCLNDHCHDEDVARFYYTPQELVEALTVDDIYFKSTGGGITFGGGEPLLHSQYIEKVCMLADEKWQLRVETSLNVEWMQIERLLPHIDRWIVDIKDIDAEIYKSYTGCDNRQMLENLQHLVTIVGKDKVFVRIPYIPNYNSEKEIQRTLTYLQENLGVETEVFEYFVDEITEKTIDF